MTLTKGDLSQISKLLTTQLSIQKEEILGQVDLKFERFRSDFYNRVDPILKEVTTAREERPLIENRLEKLEALHPNGKHNFTS